MARLVEAMIFLPSPATNFKFVDLSMSNQEGMLRAPRSIFNVRIVCINVKHLSNESNNNESSNLPSIWICLRIIAVQRYLCGLVPMQTMSFF